MRTSIVLLGLAVSLSLVAQPALASSNAGTQMGTAVKLYYGTYGSNDFIWGTAEAPPPTDAWQVHSQMPNYMMDNVAASDGNHVYVAAGYDIGQLFYRHAVGSTSWETMARCPLYLTTGGAGIIGDTFYYCGGYDAMTTAADTLLKYSISGNSWTAAPGPYSGTGYNWAPTVVACAGKLYFCSGCAAPGADNPTTQVWCYTPGAGWAQVASMNLGRVFAHAASYHDTIWMAGGNTNTVGQSHTEFYDPVADTWVVNNTVFSTMPTDCWAGAGGVTSDKMFVAAGVKAGVISTDNYVFDFASRTWSTETGMPLAVYRTAACGTVDGKAIVYGGSTGSFTPTAQCQFEQLIPPATDDVGAQQVLAPMGILVPGPIQPEVRIRNFGTNPESGILLTCWIDSAGTRVFTDTTTHPGPLAPTTTADVAFPDTWTGVDGNTYQVTMFTSLSGDLVPANDTAHAWVKLQSIAVEEHRDMLGGSIDNVTPTMVRDRVRINFTVARRGQVSLGVYDVTGSPVRTLVDGTLEPGSQSVTWDRTNSSGRSVANGTYFYCLTVDGKSVSGKAIVLK